VQRGVGVGEVLAAVAGRTLTGAFEDPLAGAAAAASKLPAGALGAFSDN
jgi:hypothetical protein